MSDSIANCTCNAQFHKMSDAANPKFHFRGCAFRDLRTAERCGSCNQPLQIDSDGYAVNHPNRGDGQCAYF